MTSMHHEPEERPADWPSEWPSEWLRAVLELCVLRILADGPTYGYEIATRLADEGLGTVKGGTLYPLLQRFEQSGRVEVDWRPGDGGPGRKYYLLTDAGRADLAARRAHWHQFVATTADILTPQEETP
ncbi:PadR family transcriptional regulator [Nesterenkonia halophila]|uniref:PadR family transcriptional regulator n=1 Tax=Nesterenkonia halophila TaxID=302044 RepID=UPI0012916A38|nr:PadR family transcriptional regulator [Nesterenkonia halophila]